MHRRVNIMQYVKTPAGKWQWEPIPKNKRTGNYVWSKVKGDNFYVVWREHKKRRYEKAGSTPSAALEAKRRKEFELAGRAVLERGKAAPKPTENGFTVEAAVTDYLEFIKIKSGPGRTSATASSWTTSWGSSNPIRSSATYSHLISTPSETNASKRQTAGSGR